MVNQIKLVSHEFVSGTDLRGADLWKANLLNVE